MGRPQLIPMGRNVYLEPYLEDILDEMIAADVKRYERNARRRARYAEKKAVQQLPRNHS